MIQKKKKRSSVSSVSTVVASVLFGAVLIAQGTWTIPDGANTEKNPLASTPDVLKHGESLYKSNCAGCHGPAGLGDGPNGDRKDRKNRPANLAISRNPDGVVFYQAWNGRKHPDMPAFKSRKTKDEVWAVAAYLVSLRH